MSNDKQGQLARIERREEGVLITPQEQPQGISVEQAFAVVMEGKLDAPKLAVMERLMAMDSERKFNTAFVQLQTELPIIEGRRGIPDRSGAIKFRYANFEDIDLICRPICMAHGFCYSFTETDYKDGKCTTTMMLTHVGGHTRQTNCTVRVGQGPPGATVEQADGSAHAYGRRGALELGLCLRIVGAREDAGNEGDTSAKVTAKQAEELEHRVAMTNSNKEAFLKLAGSTTFAGIPANKYEILDSQLRRKEAGR